MLFVRDLAQKSSSEMNCLIIGNHSETKTKYKQTIFLYQKSKHYNPPKRSD
jgi:hypothetical protein